MSNMQQPINLSYYQANSDYGYVAPAINPYTGYPIDKNCMEKYLDYSLGIEKQKFQNALDIEKERCIYEMRKDLDDRKTENALRREEGMYRRKINREMAQYCVFENSEGFLCLEMTFPNGERTYSKPVVNSRNLYALCVCNVDSHDREVCIIRSKHSDEQIILYGKSLCSDGFSKQLEQKGISILVCRERRKMVTEMIFTYLLENAKITELPDSLGWHQTKKGWFFTDLESKTIMGAMKGEFIDD